MNLNIAIRIFSDLERSRFISLFEIIPARLNAQWTITDCANADVVLIDASEPGSEYFLNACKSSVAALPILYGDSNVYKVDWFVGRPARASSLIDVLNGIAEALSNSQQNDSTQRSDENLNANDNNSQKLMHPAALMIQKLIEDSHGKHCQLFKYDTLEILIDHDLQQAFIDDEYLLKTVWQKQLSSHVCDIPQAFSVASLADNGESFKATNKKRLDFKQLQWLCFLFFSRGIIHEELLENSVFQLKRWPDFIRLPHTPTHVLLSAALVKRSVSIDELARLSNVERNIVVNFINACHHYQLIRNYQRTSKVLPFSPPKKVPIMDKIISKLFG